MTLVEFIKSKIKENSRLGDLARDIQNDIKFPVYKSETEIISYLNFNTAMSGTTPIVEELLKEFHLQNKPYKKELLYDEDSTRLKSENWTNHKKKFKVDKVILIGKNEDYYNVYCINTSIQKALYFNLKSSDSLNDISVVNERQIYIANLSSEVSVGKAIELLEQCPYNEQTKPNEENFKQLLEFLKLNQ